MISTNERKFVRVLNRQTRQITYYSKIKSQFKEIKINDEKLEGTFYKAFIEDLYSDVIIKKYNINKRKLLLLLIDLPADTINIIAEYLPRYTANNASTGEIIYGSYNRLLIPIENYLFNQDHLLLIDGDFTLVNLANKTAYYFRRRIFDEGRTLKKKVILWLSQKRYNDIIFRFNKFVIHNYTHCSLF